MDERETRWAEFDALGIQEMRKRMGSHVFGEEKMKLSREWIAHQESLRASADSSASLAEARSANELARSANDLAERAIDAALQANSIAETSAVSAALSVRKARNTNIIASIAATLAAIAIVVSIIGWSHNGKGKDEQKTEAQTH